VEESVKVGQILLRMSVKQSRTNSADGITFQDRFVIIVKNVNLGKNERRIMGVRIDKVTPRMAFGSAI